MIEWISVNDRLPSYSDSFLCWHHNCSVEIATYSEVRREFSAIGLLEDKPSHWMPLPEPPHQEAAA